MSRVLMIGAGGVATVAAFKIVQNQDVFTEFMIASRRKEKCDKLVKDIHAKGYKMDIQTAEVDADDVEQLKAQAHCRACQAEKRSTSSASTSAV